MRSHELARELLEHADAPVIFDCDGQLLESVDDIGVNLDGELTLDLS